MNAQQAPTGWQTLSARQASRFDPVQTALKIKNSRIGGITQSAKRIAMTVSAEFSGEENRFARSQPTMPVVEPGGGRVAAGSRRRKAVSTALIPTAPPAPRGG